MLRRHETNPTELPTFTVDHRIMGTVQAGQALGISRDTAKLHAQKGQLAGVRAGNRWYVSL